MKLSVHGFAVLVLFAAAGVAASIEPIPLDLQPEWIHQLEFTPLAEEGWQIRTVGNDPYLHTQVIDKRFKADEIRVFSFEYTTDQPCPLHVYFASGIHEVGSIHVFLPAAADWRAFTIDLGRSTRWNRKVKTLRLDFGSEPGRMIRLRNLQLCPLPASNNTSNALPPAAPAAESMADDPQEDRRLLFQEERIEHYLNSDYPCRITRVAVEEKSVRIEGVLAEGTADVFLCEAPLHQNLIGPGAADRVPLSALSLVHRLSARPGAFTVGLSRLSQSETGLRDRLFSRWLIARSDPQREGRFRILSHARWADEFFSLHDLSEEKPRSVKGLAAIDINRPMEDLDALGIGCATVNVVLNRLLASGADYDTIPYELNGKRWRFHRAAVEHLDQTLLAAARRRVVVAAVVLIGRENKPRDPRTPSTLLAHPDCEQGATFAMPDVASPEGAEVYHAVMDFLAARYSRPDGRYGRIHHWIMHNEIDMGFERTSAGRRGPQSYMDLYHRSMRLAYFTARRYDPHAKVFISLTHCWDRAPHERGYRPRQLLDILSAYGRREGDFEWALAYHPCPEDPFEPKTWRDKRANFTLHTPLITFRNIEVLDAWARLPETAYRGRPRTIWLSEQGFNSRDYSEAALREQAAGLAYAWKKIAPLDTIEAFCYHNWIDNGEGGLRIGLRKLPEDGLEPKPAWHLYRALGTPKEDAACDFAKDLIGIATWDRIRHTDPIR